MLSEAIAPRLARAGFKRQADVFRRRFEGGWQIVEFAKQKWSSRWRVEFAVELGVQLDVLTTAEAQWGGRGWPMESECDLRHRLIADGNQWFRVGPLTSPG